MNDMVMAIKFNEPVWHDAAYTHPQLHKTVGPDFFDRSDLKVTLKQAIHDTEQPLVIFQGERRSGKSSLLRLLENYLQHTQDQVFLPIHLSWHSITTRRDLINEILQSITFELDIDLMDESVAACINGDQQFVNLLRQFCTTSQKTIVICVDEFDSAFYSAGEATQLAWLNVVDAIAKASDLPVKFLLTLVRRPDCPADHALATAPIYPIRPFTTNDLDEMVSGLLTQRKFPITAKIRHQLFEYSGGWPYFAKLLLVSLASIQPDEHWFQHAIAQALKHPLLDPALIHIYIRHFTEDEKKVVLRIAKKHGVLPAETVEQWADGEKTAVSNLIQRHYLQQTSAGIVKFRIGLLAVWFPQWIQFEEELHNRIDADFGIN